MNRCTRPVGVTVLAVLGLAVAACSDDGTGPDEAIEPFVGTWFASRFEFIPIQSVIPVRVDLVQQGVALTLEVRPEGRFVIAQGAPGGEPQLDRGRLEVNERTARVTFVFDEDDPLEGSFFFRDQGRVLQLGLAGAAFDFNDDGETVPARAELVLEKDVPGQP